MIYWKFKYSRTQCALVVGVSEFLSEKYLEKDSIYCKNKVPEEGIVVRLDNSFEIDSYKLKSFRFFEKETKDFDNGIVDIETQESVES